MSSGRTRITNFFIVETSNGEPGWREGVAMERSGASSSDLGREMNHH
jgi:hypothetical protein